MLVPLVAARLVSLPQIGRSLWWRHVSRKIFITSSNKISRLKLWSQKNTSTLIDPRLTIISPKRAFYSRILQSTAYSSLVILAALAIAWQVCRLSRSSHCQLRQGFLRPAPVFLARRFRSAPKALQSSTLLIEAYISIIRLGLALHASKRVILVTFISIKASGAFK